MLVVKPRPEHRAREHAENAAFHFNLFFHDLVGSKKSGDQCTWTPL
jgi:hypothetical protein